MDAKIGNCYTPNKGAPAPDMPLPTIEIQYVDALESAPESTVANAHCPICLLEFGAPAEVTERFHCGHSLHYVCWEGLLRAALDVVLCPFCQSVVMQGAYDGVYINIHGIRYAAELLGSIVFSWTLTSRALNIDKSVMCREFRRILPGGLRWNESEFIGAMSYSHVRDTIRNSFMEQAGVRSLADDDILAFILDFQEYVECQHQR